MAVAVAAILGLEAAAASPATFVVDSTADAIDAMPGDGRCASAGGACTLRAAIQEANALLGADVVEVRGGTYALAIAPQNENGIATGDLDVTDGLTIAGTDAVVDARGLDRVFEVAAEGATVAFQGLTLRGGDADEYGGAIAVTGAATVTVSACTLTGNVAGKAGGAIDNHLGGTVEVRDSTVSGNYATESGSALNNNRGGTLAVVRSTIAENSAAAVGLDPALVGAGAIANNAELDAAGTITVVDSEVAGNRAGGGHDGAGIANDGTGSVSVLRTTFSGNVATADGGAIYNGGGTLTVVDSTFDANGAGEGGAIYANAADGRATVRGASFASNFATGRGGAVANSGTGLLTLLESTFTANTAADWGGGVLNDNKGAVAMAEIAFHGNTALSGGGFANEGSGPVTVDDSTFTANSALPSILAPGGEGGGMHSSSGGEVHVRGGSFSGNDALDGGGLSNAGGGTLDVIGTRFEDNHADERGGGILIESGAVRMADIDVVGNHAGGLEEAGGGISYAGDKSSVAGEAGAIEASRIRDNDAAGPGGGIDSRGDGLLSVLTTSITGNRSAAGGAINHVGDAPLEVARSTLAGNVARDDGGGVLTDGDGEATILNSTVSGNHAGQFGGGVLVSSRLALLSSTVALNSAASGGGVDNGGGDQVADGTVSLRNTIVAASPTGGNCAGTITSLGGNVEDADMCLLRGPRDRARTDPRLGALADNGGPTRTHALRAGSPAQDNAWCGLTDPCPAVDQRGVARPLFAGYDAGAYESETAPAGGGGSCGEPVERPVAAAADTWVSQSAPGANFGSGASLRVGAGARALIRFALPAVPAGCKLVGATLRVRAASSASGRTLEALRLAAPWIEGAVTWTSQPPTAGAAASAPSGQGVVEWDVLAQARDMYALGAHGFLVRDAGVGGGEQSFDSRESDGLAPELVLRFGVPDDEPLPSVCPTNPQRITADRDSWIDQGSPAGTSGGDSSLKVRSQSGSNSRALVRFPLPALPAACTGIASATLRMEAASAREGRTLEAVRVAAAWDEHGVTWGNQPATAGAAAPVPSAAGALEWDVTSQVVGIFGSANHGLLIRDAQEGGPGSEQTFNSREKTDGRPELVIAFDDTRPETTIDSGPPSPSDSSSARFEFSSDRDDAEFECSLDSAPFTSCASPHVVTGVVPGDHSFEVRAKRNVRAVDPTPARYEWTVAGDAPPRTTLVGPVSPSSSPSATLTFSSDVAGATFECSVDGAPFAPCSSPLLLSGLQDGPHEVRVRATAGGATGPVASHSWTVDTVPPAVTITSAPEDPSNDRRPTFQFAGEPGATLECRLDDGPWSSCGPLGPLADGPHTLSVRATDAAGNTGPAASHSWTVDTLAPQTTIDGGPTGLSRDATPTFEFSAEPGASFECRVDNAAFTPCSSPHTAATLPDGSHTFEVRATDAAGNTDATPASRAFTVDTTPPQTTIDAGPTGLTRDATPTFEFSSEPGASFECRIDDAAFTPCPSPYTTSALTDGEHRFEVRATDAAGNIDATPARRTINVDTLAPQITIDAGPAGLTRDATPTFEFSAEAGASFECRVDDDAFTACNSPHTTATLADGPHTFEVRAIDAAGNTDASPASRAFTVDTTPPQTTIDTGPTGLTRDATATFEFSGEPGATFECRVGDAAFTPCSSPYTTPALSDGEHTVEVRASDAAGNADATPASRAFTVDTVPPQTTIDGGPASLTRDAMPTFEFSSEPGASFECRIDDDAFAACGSPYTSSALADGPHSFHVRATDAAGNTDATPATRTFEVDTAPPQTTIDAGPSGPTRDATPTFEFSSEPGASFECRVDDAAFAPCGSPLTASALDDGPHTFVVRASDAAGNTDATPATRTYTVDSSVPDRSDPNTSLTAKPPALSNDPSASFMFSGHDDIGPVRFECRLDSGAAGDFAACDSPKLYSGLTDGPHVFDVRAVDGAGNTDPTPASHVWTIDTTAPQTTIDSGPGNLTADPTPTFEFSSESGAGFECRLAAGDWQDCQSPSTIGPLGDGTHTLDVRAVDAARNADPTPAGRAWAVDTTAPDTAITDGPADGATVAETTATFAFTAEQGASFECSLDGAAFAPCSSPHAYSGLAAGAHTFSVRAKDAAGHTDGSAAQRAWNVATAGDNTGPPPPPPKPSEPTPIEAELTYRAKVRKTGTTLRSLRLTGVPEGALVRVRCNGRSCPRRSVRMTATAGGVVKLRPFQRERLRPGTTLRIRITKAGMTDALLTLKVRSRRPPRVTG